MSGRDLRFEVLNMMAKRDLALSEEYFAKLQSTKAIRLIQSGRLSNTQCAASYIDVARLLRETERQRSLELLEDAVRGGYRIEGDLIVLCCWLESRIS